MPGFTKMFTMKIFFMIDLSSLTDSNTKGEGRVFKEVNELHVHVQPLCNTICVSQAVVKHF